jgi:hypothetical protein
MSGTLNNKNVLKASIVADKVSRRWMLLNSVDLDSSVKLCIVA